MSRMETPNSKYAHLFAVLRYDEPVDGINWESAVTVLKVFTTRAPAESEAERLRSINGTKCAYAVQTTRLVPG